MIVELVKQDGSDGLGVSRVERYHDVRSVEIPSSRGMVRLDDVVDLLLEDDDVPRHAVERVKSQIDDDPDTGGHIGINTPSSTARTAVFDEVEIYPGDVHDARGSAVVGPDETWLKVVIPKELNSEIFDAVEYNSHGHEWYNKSGLIEAAVEEYLDDSDDEPTHHNDVIDALQSHFSGPVTGDDAELRHFVVQVDEFTVSHLNALLDEGITTVGALVTSARSEIFDVFEAYHRTPYFRDSEFVPAGLSAEGGDDA